MYLSDPAGRIFVPMNPERRAGDAPTIGPGQIWLMEQQRGRELGALDAGALAGADIVLYEKVLTALLPRLGYAEPLAADTAAIAARALSLAADGWRVVQLVEPCPIRRRRLGAAALTQLPGAGDGRRVQAIVKSAARRCRRCTAAPAQLPELIAALAEDDLLTLIVGPLAADLPAYACAGNGLAG